MRTAVGAMRLTKKACEELAARPPDDGPARPVLWDESLPGFGARLNSPGRVSFVLRYRVRGDPRQRLLTVGEFGATTPEAARAEAAAIKAAAKLGRDMLAERRAAADEAAWRVAA